MGGKVPQLPDEKLAPFDEFPEVPFEIKMIAAAPFFHVSKQKGVELFSGFLKNVEKTLKFKKRIDPTPKLTPELHQFYDYKIMFIKSKQPKYGFLYSMFQKKFQVLKKKTEILAKGFIRTNSFSIEVPVLFVKKSRKSLVYA